MDFEKLFPMRVYMNLDRRPDRRRVAEAEFRAAKLKVARWASVDGKRVRNTHGFSWPSRYAVSLSKRLIVRAARNEKMDAVFIFEDDVVLHSDWRDRVNQIKLPDDWGMFLLGCQHLARPEPVAPGLVRVAEAADNHAIGIRRDWYERVLFVLRHGRDDARIWPHTASDRHLAALMREVPTYAPCPNLAWQRKAVSDQTGKNYTHYDASGTQVPNRHLLSHIGQFWNATSAAHNDDHWLCDEELDYLRGKLRGGMQVLEYGTAGLWHCEPAEKVEWHSIEYDITRYRMAQDKAQANSRHVHYVPPEWCHEHRHSPSEDGQFRTYSRKCLELGRQFDVVILKGRSRVECALAAARVLKPGGWLFFHDYFTRLRYQRRAVEMLPFYRMTKSFRHTPHTMAVFTRIGPS
jgi:hypothetical protein